MTYAWSRQHDSALRSLHRVGAKPQTIATRLDRTPEDVTERIHALGLGDPLSPDLEARLAHCYGPERAATIMAGKGPATETDVAAWNRLGRQGRAA